MYWFDPNPGPPSDTFRLTGISLGIEFALLVYASMRINNMKDRFSPYSFRLAKRVVGAAQLIICLAITAVLGRIANIPVLSMRSVLLGIFLLGIALAGYFAYFMYRVYPARAAAYAGRASAIQYMPKPKSSNPRRNRDKKKRRK